MRKLFKTLTGLALCLCLVLSAVPVLAEEAAEPAGETLYIENLDDFLQFAEDCRLDSYSRELTVILNTDIDLTDSGFQGVPTFGGTFEGGGHTISGLSITQDGSVLGLFRYLQQTAVVRELHVEGHIAPAGSRSAVGGIAGSNGGVIENCSFDGTVTGADTVGGLVGSNTLTGVIDGCTVSGTVVGNHFTGGVAGENLGVIRQCVNLAQVNTTAAQNSVELSDITLETLTGSESAGTVTDVGGIAGMSSGVIRDCENRGNVGYRHMGYNIGGIVGTQSGYVYGCVNYGSIDGRKEVGGIVGQLEPASTVEYSVDTLQILQGQLNTLGGLVDQTATNALNSTATVNLLLGNLQGYVATAQGAVNGIIPDRDDPTVPNMDSLQAAANTLSSCLSGISSTLRSLVSATQNMTGTLTRDLQAIQEQMAVINATVNNSSEALGGSLSDASDGDTAEDLTAKVESCENHGTVLADLNAGGITGAIALENDLDPEEDIDISGDSSLNFATEVRAVVLNCENAATVTVRKQNGGGIVGWMSLGLVKGCVNTGTLDGENADYVGGIAGLSSSYIRESAAKCVLTGSSNVGGIAGRGDTVTDCRSMVRLTGTEKLGAILGEAEARPDAAAETPAVKDNYYLAVDADFGAVDGISYAGCAEPLDKNSFLSLPGLNDVFRYVTLRFVFEDGTQEHFRVVPGGKVLAAAIPAVPEKDGFVGTWEGLENVDLSGIFFDTEIHAVYTQKLSVIQSSQQTNGKPVLLAQGEFTAEAALALTACPDAPALAEGETLLESWEFSLSKGRADTLRYLNAAEYPADSLTLMLRSAAGQWYAGELTVDGSYLVFSAGAGDTAFCLIRQSPDMTLLWLAIGAGVLALAGLAWQLVRRKKKPAAAQPQGK